MSAPVSSSIVVDVHTQGFVTPDEVTYARTKIENALRYSNAPVLSVRAKLSRQRQPYASKPVVVQVNLSYNGMPLRAQAAGATFLEVSDEVRDRLRDQLQHAARDRSVEHGGHESHKPPQWRRASSLHGKSDTSDEREVVRHKTYAIARTTVDDAIDNMKLLGYDFHLFTEFDSGSDCVVYRTVDGYTLSQVRPHNVPADNVLAGNVPADNVPADKVDLAPIATPITISSQQPPVLTIDEAEENLDVAHWPFVFFIDAATGRGCVLYARYDGNYGLIVPSD